MITQSINLNLITGQVLPRVNASQYDNNTRTLTMYLYDGELTFNIPNGVSGYIQGTKPDRTGFQYLATVTAGSNVVTFDITEQMTAVAGDVICELVLVDGDDRIATVNFILHVEPAALSDDTVISETDLPLIEEAAELAQQIGGFIEQMDADAAKSEAFGAGTVNGVPVTNDNPAYENNAKYYSDEAAASASGVQQLKEDSEAYAVGTRNGVPVTSGDATYHNNAKYYANAASGSASTAVASDIAAAQSKEDAEAWAVGERDSTPVTSGDVTYENNAKYYSEEAADSATAASTSETNAGLSESAAAQSEEDAEAWANGTRNGVPVTSGDAAYHNNAKYWADEVSGAVNDMVGATSSTAGVHGLVPAPAAGDNTKFLGGDGTWKDVPEELNELGDVTLTTPANGQVIRYNSTSQKWENVSVDSTPTENSDNLVGSGGIYTALHQLSYVGMIIHSTTLNTEAKVKAFYGGTSWSKIEGKFLLGTSSTHTIGSTGGEESHILTTNEMPSHSHGEYVNTSDGIRYPYSLANGGGESMAGNYFGSATPFGSYTGQQCLTGATGGGQAHNNMPPYKTVYIWERTA